jgi:hypothetical protein
MKTEQRSHRRAAWPETRFQHFDSSHHVEIIRKRSLHVLLGMLMLLAMGERVYAQGGFPTWPFVVGAYERSLDPLNAKPAHLIDWKTTIMSTFPTVTANNAAPACPGFDECGNLRFYVLHSGKTNDGELFIYGSQGQQLLNGNLNYSSGQGLNCSRADGDVQVLPVPDKPNSWYIIYSQNVSSSEYTPSNILYAKLKYDVQDGSWWMYEKDIPIPQATPQQPATYNKGKAVSQSVTILGQRMHYLYVCVRTATTDPSLSPWANKIQLVRYQIKGTANAADGITFSGLDADKSPLLDDPYWHMTTTGSPIEIDHQNKRIAMLSRNETDNGMNLYLFDASDLSLAGNCRSINLATQLLIEPNTVDIPAYTTAQSASWQNSSTPMPWLKNFERKMGGIEFSPLGKYLYIAGGGYVAGRWGNLTYLGKIDLSALNGGLPAAGASLNVRIQTQYVDGWNAAEGVQFNDNNPNDPYNLTPGANLLPWAVPQDAGYWKHYHGIGSLQSCYDGNLYFTKANCDTMWVLPNPDANFADFPVRLTPGNVNLAAGAAVNKKFDGYVQFFPDQIDGFDYVTSPDVQIAPPGPIYLTVGGLLTQNLVCVYQNITVTDPARVQWSGCGGQVAENADASCTITPTVPGTCTITVEYTATNGMKCYQNIDVIVTDSVVTNAVLGDRVWHDADKNGVQDNGEAGIPGIPITLHDGNANVIGSTTTAADGSYQFKIHTAGSYYLTVTPTATYNKITQEVNTPGDMNSDFDVYQHWTDPITITPADIANNLVNNDIDCGLYDSTQSKPVTICGKKYNDLDGDGQQDPGEPGLPLWWIVINENTSTEQQTLTDANGNFCFTNLPAGTYIVSEHNKPGWTQTQPQPPGTYTVALDSGQSSQTLLFGNHRTGCDDAIIGTANPDPLSCTYQFSIQSALGNTSKITSIVARIIDDQNAVTGTLADLQFTGCGFTPALAGLLGQSVFAITFPSPCSMPLAGKISVTPTEPNGWVTVQFLITHEDGSTCTTSVKYQCCPPDPCTDLLRVTPWPDDLQVNMDWRTFRIDNGEPGNPIKKVEIEFWGPNGGIPAACSGGTHQGGRLMVDGTVPDPMPNGPFLPPYDVVDLSRQPGFFASNWLSFNLGVDIYCTWSGNVSITITHMDGEICVRHYYGWTITPGLRQSIVQTPGRNRKLVSRTLQVTNPQAGTAARWATVTLRTPEAVLHSVTGGCRAAAASAGAYVVGQSYMGRTTAMFEFAVPLQPFHHSDDINIVLAIDSGSTTVPVLRVVLFDESGNVIAYDTTTVLTSVSFLGKRPAADEFDLLGSFPNPANGMTTINYVLGRRAEIRLELFSELGARVAVLQDGSAESGISTARFDVRGLAAGNYYLRLSSGERASTLPLVVVK